MSQLQEGSRVRLEFQGAQATNHIVSQQLALLADSSTRYETMSDDGQAAATSINADLMGEVMQGAKIRKLLTHTNLSHVQQNVRRFPSSRRVNCCFHLIKLPPKGAHHVTDL